MNYKDIEAEWRDFFSARKTGIKKIWKPLFEKRLENIESLSGIKLQEYVEALCSAYFEHNRKEIPIQNPQIWDKVLEIWSLKLKSPDVRHLLWIYKAFSFKGVYNLLKLEPKDIIEKVLEITPNHAEAEQLLFAEHLNLLDFALHHLPTCLVVEESVCVATIKKCEMMIGQNPELLSCETRFNLNYTHYKKMFDSWVEYKNCQIKEDFFERIEQKKLTNTKK